MTTLKPGEVLCMTEAEGMTVTAHGGTVWITEQGSARDVMLRSGESFRLTRRGLAVVEAFDEAAVSLES
jgi:hypothetical protein